MTAVQFETLRLVGQALLVVVPLIIAYLARTGHAQTARILESVIEAIEESTHPADEVRQTIQSLAEDRGLQADLHKIVQKVTDPA